MLRFLIALLLGIGSTWSTRANTKHCEKIINGFEVHLCIDTPKNSTNTIVYYLHGAGNSEQVWFDDFFYTGQVREYWKVHSLPRPKVVSISFDFSKFNPELGRSWLLVPKNADSPVSGLFEYFQNVLIPEIDKVIGFTPKKRFVFGESMGGFNTALLGLKTAIFEKAAVICSPMAEGVTPFSSEDAKLSYMKTSIAWNYFSYIENGHEIIMDRTTGMNKLLKAFVPTEGLWPDVDPIELAKMAKGSETSFYVTAGAHDPYLTYEGSQRFSEILQSQNVSSEWRPQWGGHCTVDIPSLARFLSH